jgi:hypothetical protein
MSNLNQRIKEQAEPGVFEVIQWALMVHEDTMKMLRDSTTVVNHLISRYSLTEREEARKILLEYGAGKPTRIVEHRGSKSQPLQFETRVVTTQKQLNEPATIDAEIVQTNGISNP